MIANTQAEIVVSSGLRAIRDLGRDQGTVLNNRYNTVKTYVLNNTSLFDSGDVAKLNSLQIQINAALTALDTLETTIDTDFPGL